MGVNRICSAVAIGADDRQYLAHPLLGLIRPHLNLLVVLLSAGVGQYLTPLRMMSVLGYRMLPLDVRIGIPTGWGRYLFLRGIEADIMPQREHTSGRNS